LLDLFFNVEKFLEIANIPLGFKGRLKSSLFLGECFGRGTVIEKAFYASHAIVLLYEFAIFEG
tara:strand:- start:751 stop:939 length:189 start_codon:yes stop_codon:yes gene_type:complete